MIDHSLYYQSRSGGCKADDYPCKVLKMSDGSAYTLHAKHTVVRVSGGICHPPQKKKKIRFTESVSAGYPHLS